MENFFGEEWQTISSQFVMMEEIYDRVCVTRCTT